MTNTQRKKPRLKPVTLDDYRRDRDFWKLRANDQQRRIDQLENSADSFKNEASDLRAARDYYKKHLQEICTHPKVETRGSLVRCDRCKEPQARNTQEENT